MEAGAQAGPGADTADLGGSSAVLLRCLAALFGGVSCGDGSANVPGVREEACRALVEATDVGLVILDHEARVRDANPPYARLAGYAVVAEIIGRSVLAWTSPHQQEQVAAALRTCLDVGESGPLQFDHVDAQGRVAPVTMSAIAIGSGPQRLILGLCRAADTAPRAPGALSASERQYRATVDAMHEAIHVVDEDLRVVLVNHTFLSWCSRWGLTPVRVGQRVGEAFPFLPPRVFEEYRHVLQSAQVLITEEVTDLNGTEVITETRKIPVVEDGSVRRVVTVVRDITAARRAQRALRESEERFRALVEATSDWVWETDAAGVYTYASPKVRDLLGYEPQEVIGKTPFEFMPPAEASRVAVLFKDRAEHAQPLVGVENISVCKDGRPVWLETSAVPILGPEGRLLGYRGIDRDITARRNAEDERRSLERQVQQAQKLESLGVLAGGIAHDFNNLLTAILGHAGLALMELPPESLARESLQEIQNASRRAADLCRQMLAYSGRGPFAVELLDLTRLVQETTAMLQVAVPRTAVLHFQLQDSLPPVQADATQLRQVVMSLAINAAEALVGGAGVVAIATGLRHCDEAYLSQSRTAQALPPGPYVFVEVADNGCGMDAGTQARMFDPFFSTKFTGRGLGLAAVLGIMRSHRGAIRLESTPGRGTTMTALFPAAAAESQPVAEAPAVGTWQGSGTVLLVDDEDAVRAVAQRILASCGFRVLTAVDGQDAVRQFRDHAAEIVCVVLDLTMPRMDGAQAFQELRRIRTDVRVILASGYSCHEISQRFSGQGLAGVVQKPFDVATLREALRQALTPAGPAHA